MIVQPEDSQGPLNDRASLRRQDQRPMEHLILDIEIQRTIGGPDGLTWDDTDQMGVSIATVYSVADDQYTIYGPDDLHRLRHRLEACGRLTTFNGWTFDLPVIFGLPRPMVVDQLRPVNDDLLARIWAALGRREHGWTLNDIARGTLGRGKMGMGEEAPLLFQQGRWVELVNYCLEDVRLTRDVLRQSEASGTLTNGFKTIRLPPWEATRTWRNAP